MLKELESYVNDLEKRSGGMFEEHEIVCKCSSGLKITAYSYKGVIDFKVSCKNCGIIAAGKNLTTLINGIDTCVNNIDNTLEDIL